VIGRFAVFLAGVTLSILIGAATGSMPLMAILLAALTVGLSRRDGMPIATLGLPLNTRRARELAIGLCLTAPLFLAIAWIQSRTVGAAWTFQGTPGIRAAVAGLAFASSAVLIEELIFRGAALGYLRRLIGDRDAVAASAVCFGFYHVIGSRTWGMGAVFQFLMPTLGGLVFGWAAVRSRGLALPIGLHLGGNWVQAGVAVFAPLGAGPAFPPRGIWTIPVSAADVAALTAPDVLPRLPYLVALTLAAAVTWQLTRAGLSIPGPDARLQ
jgi:membrane protease YdiL (CAAX protease family)